MKNFGGHPPTLTEGGSIIMNFPTCMKNLIFRQGGGFIRISGIMENFSKHSWHNITDIFNDCTALHIMEFLVLKSTSYEDLGAAIIKWRFSGGHTYYH